MAVNVSGTVQVGGVNVSAQVETHGVNATATVQRSNTAVSASVEHRSANVSATAQTRNTNVCASVNPHIMPGGTSDHAQLQNLDYDNAGHTGFQRELIPDESITIDEQGHIHANGESYTAGQNISIDENNVISAVDTTYTQGNGITIDQENVISNDVYPLVPPQATSSNQLADKDFVNSSIATSTATFRGTYNVVTDLHLSTSATHQQVATALGNTISVADNNDYCFVEIPTDDLTPTETLQVDRYKYNGSSWSFEYTLNNSGYTSAQWKAINSGITSGKVTQYDDYATSKQDNLIAGTNITIGVDGKTISSDIPQATQSVAGKVLLGASGGAATFESVENRLPICYPTTASSVTVSSMVLKSSVDGNGRMLTENGFVYNTSGNPTISDTKVVCELNNCQFETKLTGLAENTQYHIRSYAINSSGLSYGDELIQSTLLNPIPNTYQLVEQLINFNSQVYIDTGYKPNLSHTIIVDNISITWFNVGNGQGGQFGCSRTNVTPNQRFEFTYNARAAIYNSSNTAVNYMPQINKCKLIISPNYIQINESKFQNNLTENSSYNFFLFARNLNGSISGYFYGAIGSFKVLDSNNQYIRRMYPVYRIADNIPGMYDIANGVFYTNQGTGEFTVGPDKEFDG